MNCSNVFMTGKHMMRRSNLLFVSVLSLGLFGCDSEVKNPCPETGESFDEVEQACVCDTSRHWTGEAGSCECEKGYANNSGVCEEETDPGPCSGVGEIIDESSGECVCDTSAHWTGDAGSCKCGKGYVNISGVCEESSKCSGHGVYKNNKTNTCSCNKEKHWKGTPGSCQCEDGTFEVEWKKPDHACCVPVDYQTDFKETPCLELADPKKGNICLYGAYRQLRASEEKQPIQWRILDVKSNEDGSISILLMSEYALDVLPYNKTRIAITWEKCTLRSWLNAFGASENTNGIDYSNDGFLKTAFTDDELSHIQTVKNTNQNHPTANTPGGNDTDDKVFLLSREEGRQYLGAARMVYGTSYATSKSYIPNSTVCRGAEEPSEIQYPLSWWTRSCSVTSDQARCVSAYNADCDLEVNYATGLSVRPALWIKK